MPLMDALRSGVDLINASNQGVQEAAKARYAYPMTQAQLERARLMNAYQGIINQYQPEQSRLTNQGMGLANNYQQILNQYAPEKLRLGNQYQGLVNKYYAPEKEADINQKNFFVENPLLKMPGAAGQVGSAIYLQNKGGLGASLPNMTSPSSGAMPTSNAPSSQDYAGLIMGNLNTLNRVRNARADLDNIRTKNYNWAQLPAETRNNFVAQGMGMGIDPVKMKNYVNDGLNIQQIAQKEGLDPNNIPSPVYFPTATTKTRVQQVQQVGAELDYMSSATTPIIKRYADTFAGFSPERLKDMLNDDSAAQKRFGQYIGALSVQTGLANGRVLLEGGKPGVEIMRMIKDSALKGIDQHSPIKMSGVAYEEAQKTIDQILQKGAKIRSMTGMNPFSGNNSSSASTDLSSLSDEELMKIAGGK